MNLLSIENWIGNKKIRLLVLSSDFLGLGDESYIICLSCELGRCRVYYCGSAASGRELLVDL
jgi:hypothetical protein